jgi:ApeA N-terminal domain 1
VAVVIQERGFFWWFNAPEGGTNAPQSAVPGMLTVSEEGRISLDLDGALWYAEKEVMHWGQPQSLPRKKFITGRLPQQEGEKRYVLLKDLLRTSFRLVSAVNATDPESYSARVCFANHTSFDSPFCADHFCQLRIKLSGLEEWLNLDSLSQTLRYIDSDRVEISVKYDEQRFNFTSEDDALSIESTAYPGLSSPYPQRRITFQQEEWAVFTPSSNASVATLLANYQRLEELLALLLGSYYRLDWPILVRRTGAHEQWHQTYSYRGVLPEAKPDRFSTWTDFHAVKGYFGQLFFAWKRGFSDVGEPYYLYMAELRHPLPYAEHKLANLIWALESLAKKQGFSGPSSPSTSERNERVDSILRKLSEAGNSADREWFERRADSYRRDPILVDRIFDSLSMLPVPFDLDTLRDFSNRCADCRNAISHGERPRNESNVSMASLASALSKLYHALLLLEIGVDRESLRQVLTQSALATLKIMPALENAGIRLLANEDSSH